MSACAPFPAGPYAAQVVALHVASGFALTLDGALVVEGVHAELIFVLEGRRAEARRAER